MSAMSIRILGQMAREDPGSNEAVDLLAELTYMGGADLPEWASSNIVDAWAKRLYLPSPQAAQFSRTIHEERLNSARVWVAGMVESWKPNPGEGPTGGASAYLNSNRARMLRDLPTDTGTASDGDPKARRVRSAAMAEASEATGLEDLRARTEERLLTQTLALMAKKGEKRDRVAARERMRKRGDLKWLARIDELVPKIVSIEDMQEGWAPTQPMDAGEGHAVIDMLAGDGGAESQRRRLCAPHLQYLIAIEDDRR